MEFDLSNPPILDPRSEDELCQAAKLYAARQSGGILNTTLEGDPLDVLIRTQAYTGSEHLYYANQLPAAFAAWFLGKMTETARSLGSKARAEVTFTLVSQRPAAFFIPAGFEVIGGDRRGSYKFYTVEELVIPAGNLTGTAIVEAADVGSAYNLAAGAINRFSVPLTFLKSVINPTAAAGGADKESQNAAISRGIAKLRSPSLVSKADYETSTQEILGLGSRALAVGLLGADKVTREKGAVHVFCLNSDGLPSNSAQIQTVTGLLNERKQLGTRLHVSPMETLRVTATVTATVTNDYDLEQILDDLWQRFRDYLNPSIYPVGGTVEPIEVAHRLRFAVGIQYLDRVELNGSDYPLIPPTLYTLPYAASLSVNLATPSGEVLTGIRTNGEPMEDLP